MNWYDSTIEMGQLVALQTAAEPPAPELPEPLDETVSYEQWIGLLYACAVFRGVLTHPPPEA